MQKKLRTSKWLYPSPQLPPAAASFAEDHALDDLEMECDYQPHESPQRRSCSMPPSIMAGLPRPMGKTLQPLALEEKDETKRHHPPGTAIIGEMAQTTLLYLEDEILSAPGAVDTPSAVLSGQTLPPPEQPNCPPSVPVRRSSVTSPKTARFKKGSPCMRRKALINSMYLDLGPAAQRMGHDVVLIVSEAVALLRKGERGEVPSDTNNKGEGEEKKSKVELWLEQSGIIGNTFAARYWPSTPASAGSARTTDMAAAAEARLTATPSRHDWATDVETTTQTYPVPVEANQASPTDGSPRKLLGKRRSEMNWKWIRQERERQNSVAGVLEEGPKTDAKKKKKTRGFSSLGKAIKLAVGGSPKREKPPDINNSPTPTPPSPSPSPSTQPSKKHRWTTTINEKYHQLLHRRQKPKPRRHLSSDNDQEDPNGSLKLPRRPNTALGIHDIDRSPYLSDLVPFLPDEEEEQYTPTWIKENLSCLLYERVGSPTPMSVGQRRPASAPCLDYPVGVLGGGLRGGTGRDSGGDSGGDGSRGASPVPSGGRRSVSAPGELSPGVVGEAEGADQGDGQEGESTVLGELSGEEDESVSDVSRSTEAAEEGEAGNERTGGDDVEVSRAEEGESYDDACWGRF